MSREDWSRAGLYSVKLTDVLWMFPLCLQAMFLFIIIFFPTRCSKQLTVSVCLLERKTQAFQLYSFVLVFSFKRLLVFLSVEFTYVAFLCTVWKTVVPCVSETCCQAALGEALCWYIQALET